MKPNESEQNDIKKPNASVPYRSWLYSQTLKIPVLGEILRIANAYTYDGDLASDIEFAPLGLWIKKHYKNFLIVIVLTVISASHIWLCDPSIDNCKAIPIPGNLIVSIFPSVLGFGIGVYALIFGLSNILVKKLQESLDDRKETDKAKIGSVLMLNVDMAYPLLVITLTLGIGVLQQIFINSQVLELAAWFALWYSMIMVIEILAVLFGLGEHELLNKLD
ncbi:MAG: hypothetical protein DU481_05775 [Nitrosomonas sp.]|uniref:hypothetical protein n=1 Tax=Nitrosomonas sp. TaxID=42353 RepID=UPI0032EB1506